MSSPVYVFNGWAANEKAWSHCSFRRERIFSYIEQLDAVPESELEKVESFILVGWSMGGSSALRMALRYPRKVKGMVLLAATARMMADDGWTGMSKVRLTAFRRGLMITKGEGFFDTGRGWPNPYSLDNQDAVDRGLEYLEHTDIRSELLAAAKNARFKFPVSIYQSERDGIVRAQNADFLKKVFPQAELQMVEGGEHCLPLMLATAIDKSVAGMIEQ